MAWLRWDDIRVRTTYEGTSEKLSLHDLGSLFSLRNNLSTTLPSHQDLTPPGIPVVFGKKLSGDNGVVVVFAFLTAFMGVKETSVGTDRCVRL